ncbi:MAG: ABC transporter permease subunit [Planctomycetota bacterium]|jgi:ABC-type transport system involved in multi-copper enzyme maturation permease subunit
MIQLRGFLVTAGSAARTALRGKRLFVLLLLTLLPILVIYFANGGKGALSVRDYQEILLRFVFQFVVPFSALFLGNAVLGDELEGRTITYLFTRPVDRGVTYLGRLFGTGLAYTVLLLASMSIAFSIRPLADDSVARGGDLAMAVGAFWCYLALFAAMRTVQKRALLIGMIYIVVLDLAVAQMPHVGLAKISIWHHVCVMYVDTFEGAAPGLRSIRPTLHPDETAAGSRMFLIGLFVVTSILGAWFTRTREYHVAGAVA